MIIACAKRYSRCK